MFARAQKALYLEILLDPFEKGLYLPPFAVDIGDSLRGKMKEIGDKHVMLSGIWIVITHASQRDGTILCLGASEQDGLVRGQSLCLDHLATLHNPVVDASFEASDKEDLLMVELMMPGKIHISPIHHYNGEGRKPQQFGYRDIGYLGGGYIDKCWDMAVMVQKSM